MDNKVMIKIKNPDDSVMEVELVTYLISDDKRDKYVVYSKGEKTGVNEDEIIYISKLFVDNGNIQISEIVDDNEWIAVQNLLKRIANA